MRCVGDQLSKHSIISWCGGTQYDELWDAQNSDANLIRGLTDNLNVFSKVSKGNELGPLISADAALRDSTEGKVKYELLLGLMICESLFQVI